MLFPNYALLYFSFTHSELLLKVLEGYSNTYSIVFCNSVPSCDWTARFLESCGIPVVKLHAGINAMVN